MIIVSLQHITATELPRCMRASVRVVWGPPGPHITRDMRPGGPYYTSDMGPWEPQNSSDMGTFRCFAWGPCVFK